MLGELKIRWSEINLGRYHDQEPLFPFLDESRVQSLTGILTIYPLGNAHFIMISALHQFEHTVAARSKRDPKC
jgi:hypothetical protein